MKADKVEGANSTSKAFFNRNVVFNRNAAFNRVNFNPFFRPFVVNDEFFFVNRFEED